MPGFAFAQLGAAGLSLLTFSAIDRLPALALQVGAGRDGTLISNAMIAAIGLLPMALCQGAAFPFAVRVLAHDAIDAAPAAARVYAWNTMGAITGALAGAFVLLAAPKFSGSIRLAAALNLSIALDTRRTDPARHAAHRVRRDRP